MIDWLPALQRRLRSGETIVRVVVANVIGSTPREAGAVMLVGAPQVTQVTQVTQVKNVDGSIGGGTLELNAIELARSLLAQPDAATRVERLVLGAMLGQCCGGALELWFERYEPAAADFVEEMLHARDRDARHSDARLLLTTPGPVPLRQLVYRDQLPMLGLALPEHFERTGIALQRAPNAAAVLLERIAVKHEELWLFGAGHVGRALVRVLADLPLRVRWIDSRAEMLNTALPENVSAMHADDPIALIDSAPRGTWFLVMTHDHQLDYALCAAICARDDFAWLGLIGSQTKATHFRGRLKRDGIDAAAIARMTCPIGLPSLKSKLPAAIAVSVAAQLLVLIEQSEFALTPYPSPEERGEQIVSG